MRAACSARFFTAQGKETCLLNQKTSPCSKGCIEFLNVLHFDAFCFIYFSNCLILCYIIFVIVDKNDVPCIITRVASIWQRARLYVFGVFFSKVLPSPPL